MALAPADEGAAMRDHLCAITLSLNSSKIGECFAYPGVYPSSRKALLMLVRRSKLDVSSHASTSFAWSHGSPEKISKMSTVMRSPIAR